jgi:molybdopterin-guanine dinucleotide biosynthesis protein MobB
VSGKSGSGKTLLIQRLVPRLAERGLRVAVVKHCTHAIRADTPGKDSDRIFRAGADVLAAGPEEGFARFHATDMPLDRASALVGASCDLCIAEGYRHEEIPRIRIASTGGDAAPGAERDNVLMVVTDAESQVAAAESALIKQLEQFHSRRPTMGLILAGGQSRRMGRHKTLLEDSRGRVMERLMEVLDGRCERTLVAGEAPLPDGLSDIPRLPDAVGPRGPMAGILSAMRWHPGARWLVLACDMPFVGDEAAGWLLQQSRLATDAVMPRRPDGTREPLFAIYEPTCRPILEAAVGIGRWSLGTTFADQRVFDPILPPSLRRAWTNVNTPEEWEAARS